MATPFNYTNENIPFITHALMVKVIFDAKTNTADIDFAEGYFDVQNEFIDCGTNHLHIEDKEAIIDPETQEVIESASTDHTDFMAILNTSSDTTAAAETFLVEKIGDIL